jgi:DNA polymerase/3'-5' exonuclease PolX
MKFGELAALANAKAGEAMNPFEAAAFRKTAMKLKALADERVSEAKISALDLTENMKNHLRELRMKVRDVDSATEIYKITQLPGVGAVTAKRLYDAGFRMKNSRKKKWREMLPRAAQLAIEVRPVPVDRKVVERLRSVLTKRNVFLTGSFRRGKEVMKDIDVLIVSNCLRAIGKYVDELRRRFGVKVVSIGEWKASLFVELQKGKWHHMDVFRAEKENKLPALIHTTGPGSLNVKMRKKAREKGYKLSEKGLIHLLTGRKKTFLTERAYYEFLGEEMGERF